MSASASDTTTSLPRYVVAGQLIDDAGHTKGVTSLSFSSMGTYLASGGLDCKLCIWDATTQKLLHAITFSNSVLSVGWVTQGEDLLLCGLEDGTLVSVVLTLTAVYVKAFWSHSYPLERLAVDARRRVASGAHPEVFVWRIGPEGCVEKIKSIDRPQNTSLNDNLEVLVTGLHWMRYNGSNALLIAYMHHGIIIVESSSWSRIRTISPYAGYIGHTGLSRDGKLLSVSNLVTGFDFHTLGVEEMTVPAKSMLPDVGEPYPTPVEFLGDGKYMLTGSTIGEARVWETHSAEFRALSLGKKRRVLAIAAHILSTSHPLASKTSGVAANFLIATGTTNPRGASAVHLWAVEGYNAPHQETSSGPSYVTIARKWILLMAQILVVGTAAGIVAKEAIRPTSAT